MRTPPIHPTPHLGNAPAAPTKGQQTLCNDLFFLQNELDNFFGGGEDPFANPGDATTLCELLTNAYALVQNDPSVAAYKSEVDTLFNQFSAVFSSSTPPSSDTLQAINTQINQLLGQLNLSATGMPDPSSNANAKVAGYIMAAQWLVSSLYQWNTDPVTGANIQILGTLMQQTLSYMTMDTQPGGARDAIAFWSGTLQNFGTNFTNFASASDCLSVLEASMQQVLSGSTNPILPLPSAPSQGQQDVISYLSMIYNLLGQTLLPALLNGTIPSATALKDLCCYFSELDKYLTDNPNAVSAQVAAGIHALVKSFYALTSSTTKPPVSDIASLAAELQAALSQLGCNEGAFYSLPTQDASYDTAGLLAASLFISNACYVWNDSNNSQNQKAILEILNDFAANQAAIGGNTVTIELCIDEFTNDPKTTGPALAKYLLDNYSGDFPPT